MARNLKKGSKVFVKFRGKDIPGVVIKKFSSRKGELNVPESARTLVHVRASGNVFSKRPSELKRRK